MIKNRIEQLEQMLLEESGDNFVRYALALEYGSSGQHAKAVEYLKAVLNSDKNYLAAYYQLGKMHEVMGDWEKAAEIYSLGMEIAKTQGNQRTFSELKAAFQGFAGNEDD